tara:strand:- start:1804 stop:2655 length:852 start_codon:yes stop_codon:yes gene_type:complete
MSQDENGLTFSQVLLVEYDSNESPIEVPEGKVWKIVSAVVSPSNFNAYFLINSNECKLVTKNTGSGGNGVDTYSPFQIFPMWLPEGTNLILNNSVTALSVIEFNSNSQNANTNSQNEIENLYSQIGCTDSEACNYDIAHIYEDNSCEYAEIHFDCDGNSLYSPLDLSSANGWDFIPPVTDNNMSLAFLTPFLQSFAGGLLQAYVNGEPVSTANEIQSDGSTGASIIGEDALCGCDLANDGDYLQFAIKFNGSIFIINHNNPVLTYQANTFHVVSDLSQFEIIQ